MSFVTMSGAIARVNQLDEMLKVAEAELDECQTKLQQVEWGLKHAKEDHENEAYLYRKDLSETQDELECANTLLKEAEERADKAEADDRAELLDIIRHLRGVLTIDDTPAMMAIRLKEAQLAMDASSQIISY